MTQSRFPFWRTRPSGLTQSGFWPVLTGTLAVLFGVPLAGGVLFGIMAVLSNFGIPKSSTLESITLVLVVSPLFSWIVMLGAVPLSAWAARRGRAGWGVAVIGGAFAGVLTTIALNGRFVLHPEVLGFAAIGVIMALSYWIAIRIAHPKAIGIDLHSGIE